MTSRKNVEKASIQALISIIENSKFNFKIGPSKLLYKALLNFEFNNENIINSKSGRSLKIEFKNYQEKIDKNRSFTKFLNLEDGLYIENFKLLITNIDEQKQAFVIYNNIALLFNNNRVNLIFEFFVKYREKLATIPESIFILVEILKEIDLTRFDKKNFFKFIKEYFNNNINELQQFQIDIIFNSFRMVFSGEIEEMMSNKELKDLMKTYNYKPIYIKLMDFFQAFFENRDYKKLENYLIDILKNNSLSNMKEIVIFIEYILFVLEEEQYRNKIQKLNNLFFNTKDKYKNFTQILDILDLIAELLLEFDFKKYKDDYKKLIETSKFYLEYFNLNIEDYENLNILNDSLKSNKKPKIKSDNVLDMMKNLFAGKDSINNELDDEFEDLYKILENIITKYGKEIKNNRDGLNILDELINFKRENIIFFNKEKLDEDVYFEFLEVYFDRYGFNDEYILKFINKLNFTFQMQTSFIVNFKYYFNFNTTLLNRLYRVMLKEFKYNTAGYLKWCFEYLIFVCEEDIKKDDFIKEIYNFSIKFQEDKKFKTIDVKFKKLNDLWRND